jgi:hypothetical protein
MATAKVEESVVFQGSVRVLNCVMMLRRLAIRRSFHVRRMRFPKSSCKFAAL